MTQPTFDYVEFVNEGFTSQQKYAEAAGQVGPLSADLTRDARHSKVIEMMSHLIEETVEARVLVPRRSWKTNEPSFLDSEQRRKEFVAEMFDILLFHRSILAFAGVSGEEFAQAARAKLQYNTTRPDHITNGTVSASQDPIAELNGNCHSAVYF